jgi:hypothetical protein
MRHRCGAIGLQNLKVTGFMPQCTMKCRSEPPRGRWRREKKFDSERTMANGEMVRLAASNSAPKRLILND